MPSSSLMSHYSITAHGIRTSAGWFSSHCTSSPLKNFQAAPPFSLKNFSPVPSPTDLLPGRGKGGKSRERQRPPAPGLQDHHYHQEAKDSASSGPAPPPPWTTADHPTTRTWPGTVRPAVNASVVGPASATSECTTWRRVLLILASFSTQ